jgi:hypothetical protein
MSGLPPLVKVGSYGRPIRPDKLVYLMFDEKK